MATNPGKGGVTGSRLTATQIYALARSAGLSPSKAIIATAVALAESGGNPSAHNSVRPDDSYGLWQINMIDSLGPARRQQFGIKSDADLLNPAINAKAMAQISNNGTNFSAWTTFARGTYRSFLGSATNAGADVENAPDVGSKITDVLKGIGSFNPIGKGLDIAKDVASKAFDPILGPLADALGTFGMETTKLIYRGIFASAGLGLIVVGVIQMVSPTIKKVGGTALQVGGAAATVAGGPAGIAAGTAGMAAGTAAKSSGRKQKP